MFENKKIIAFVPARGGSKRIPNKNLQLLNNKPLFMHSVDIAKQSKYIDQIIVSTDSNEIKKISLVNGCIGEGLRPDSLSGDRARIVDAILHEIDVNKVNADVVVLLQPTLPFRTVEMLDEAIETFFNNGEKSLITVTKVLENPVFYRTINKDGMLEKIIDQSSDVRSQDFKDYYRIIGNIYINRIDELTSETVLNENVSPFVIDRKYCLDIDTFLDLEEARKKVEEEK